MLSCSLTSQPASQPHPSLLKLIVYVFWLTPGFSCVCLSFVFDLAAAIPFWSLADAERKKYWDDAIHMTPDGYDLMGERIAAHLVELIMPPGRLQPQVNGDRPTKRRRVFKDDDKLFEEEVGDDNLLDQGYYVVRRKDLE